MVKKLLRLILETLKTEKEERKVVELFSVSDVVLDEGKLAIEDAYKVLERIDKQRKQHIGAQL